MFTNPTISIDKFNGTVKLVYEDLFTLTLQHCAANEWCDIHISIPYKHDTINNNNHECISILTGSPYSKHVFHKDIKISRITCFKTPIISALKSEVSDDLYLVCPGISIIIDRVIEEYYNAFILFGKGDYINNET